MSMIEKAKVKQKVKEDNTLNAKSQHWNRMPNIECVKVVDIHRQIFNICLSELLGCPDGESIKFCFERNEDNIEIFAMNQSDYIIVSDNGATMKFLDKIFDLQAEEVKKSIDAVLDLYEIDNCNGVFQIKLDEVAPGVWLSGALQRMYDGIAFLLAMKLFYI